MPIHGYPGNVISATPPSVTPAGASGVFTTEQQMQYQSAGNWPMPLTQISRSLRFNSADSAYLNRTPASAGNRKTWTLSFWMKRGQLTASDTWRIFACRPDSGTYTLFDIINTGSGTYPNAFSLVDNNGTNLATTAIYRDPSAWYHVVLAVDTTQATSSNRVKLYVNGSQVTAFSSATYPTQNLDMQINTANAHNIGRDPNTGVSFFDGYLTDIYLIDGQALTPASFGVTDPATGVWGPRQYTGPYGTNGFYLNFSDNSGTTSTTLGKDYSGNGNNWTPNNFSVTAGAGNDSLVDTPTPYGTDTGAGGEVRGNYATANPLDTDSTIALANGNLQYSTSVTSWKQSRATLSVPTTDKWYMEYTITATANANHTMLGFCTQAASLATYTGASANSISWQGGGDVWANNANTPTGYTFGQGDVVMFAIDRTNQKVWIGKNGTWQNSGNPSAGTGNITQFSSNVPTTGDYFPAVSINASGTTINANFGQRPFAYTAPSGFKALCTQNLPTPTIGATSTTQANRYFDVNLRNGFGSSGGSVTTVNFQPDFMWEKVRNSAQNHLLIDAVRGVTKELQSNTTAAETTGNNYLLSFNSNGMTFGSNDWGTTTTLVEWLWNAGGSNATNTSGSITSTVRANTTAGFSIVTYTGNGTTGATVGHGLGVKPSMMIFKGRTNSVDWVVYHTSLGATKNLKLNLTDAEATQSGQFNDTEPTSTLFTLGANNPVNANTVTYVAYCFAPVAGYSAFGSYTGNGSADGPMVFTGFRPAYIMRKRTDTTSDWLAQDLRRPGYNATTTYTSVLYPNTNSAETIYNEIDLLSNGFKIRANDAYGNANGGTYIYAAFAEFPFKYTLAR